MQPTEHCSRSPIGRETLRSRYLNEYIDPLDDDRASDMPVLTTERRLRRLAMTAALTGARFEREQLPEDPMSWLLAPRMMFEGDRPLDACQGLHAMLRATVLHKLSLGMDAQSADLDALLSDGDEDARHDGSADLVETVLGMDADGQDDAMRLFTCTLEGPIDDGETFVQAFCAVVAPSVSAARHRLRQAYGDHLAGQANIAKGFDTEGPLAAALLSGPVRRLLSEVDGDPAARLAKGFDFRLEQRFQA